MPDITSESHDVTDTQCKPYYILYIIYIIYNL